ncbi:glycoside hydrolase family 95 protein, partial [Xanthomonas perforans]|nr:glycoside hydrolase family 95 protein [Xanthomonas perforans]
LTIVLCGDTDYAADGARGWRDPTRDPLARARHRAQAAASVPAALLLDTHVADHRALFDTLQVELGQSSDAQRGLETWQRIQARAAAPALPDPELQVAYLRFGRYLTIAAS